jgi:hypothetical protein
MGAFETDRSVEMRNVRSRLTLLSAVILAMGVNAASAADPDTQAKLDAITAAIPKFAVPMREVGDRFQNMYFAVKGGNWALAAYMSKYMDKAMNPAKLTKPKEYPDWRNFYDGEFEPVNKAINAKDMAAFDTAYTEAIKNCNDCHQAMDYGFIKVVKQERPADVGIDYTRKSEPGAVPK